jgi:hypothetical protein
VTKSQAIYARSLDAMFESELLDRIGPTLRQVPMPANSRS